MSSDVVPEGRRITPTIAVKTDHRLIEPQETVSQLEGISGLQTQGLESPSSSKRNRTTSRLNFFVSFIRSCCCCRSCIPFEERRTTAEQETVPHHLESHQEVQSFSRTERQSDAGQAFKVQTRKEVTVEVLGSSSSSESTKIGAGVGTETTEARKEGDSMRRTKSYGGEARKTTAERKATPKVTFTTERASVSFQETLQPQSSTSSTVKAESSSMVSCTSIDPEKSQRIVIPSPRQVISMRTPEEDKKQRLRFLRMRRHTVSASSVRPTAEEASKWTQSFNAMMAHKCKLH